MKSLRRILITAAAAFAVSGIASADTIIGFTATTTNQGVDIANTLATIPSWDPGDSNTTTSNLAGTCGTGVFACTYATGVSMNSLTPTTVNYTLVGYNIEVQSVITGTYRITNTSSTSTLTGSVYIDTNNAVGLNQTLGALDNIHDPTADIFSQANTGIGTSNGGHIQGEQPSSLGGGPDPNAPAQSGLSIAPGQTFTSPSFTVGSGWVDYGCQINSAGMLTNGPPSTWTMCDFAGQTVSGTNKQAGIVGNELNNGLTSNTTGLLNFYFSSATQTDSQLTGNSSTAYQTSVQEQIVVIYDYTTSLVSTTPEPTTMVLFGSALVGLGMLRKRARR